MGQISAGIAIEEFVLGASYSRQEIASTGGLPVPDQIYGSPWADGILELDNATLLFVTLEKGSDADYLDFFDGSAFFWESQNRHTQASPIIRKLGSGDVTAYLFVRLRAKYSGTSNAMPFIYCGELGTPTMDGSKPVTCLFESLDYQAEPGPELAEIYAWRPGASSASFAERQRSLRAMAFGATRRESTAKYWRVAHAVEALGRATVQDVDLWLAEHYPQDERGDLRENLAHLTVNAPSRVHYDKARSDWRSNSGHPRDRLYQVESTPVTYEAYQPKVHGYVDLKRHAGGKWAVVPLHLSELEAAEDEAARGLAEVATTIDSEHDARVWALRMVAQRRGQPAFREKVLAAYDGRCCVTGSGATQVLEAAHILPYRGDHTNQVANALLLRSDFHTLFDLGLWWVDVEMCIHLSPALRGTEYAGYEGRRLQLPEKASNRPKPAYLARQAALAMERTQNEDLSGA